MATPITITGRFVDSSGSGIDELAVCIRLNGESMFLSDGTMVSTTERIYYTDSDGYVSISLFASDDYDTDTSRSLTDPVSYTLRIPSLGINKVVAVPASASTLDDLTEVEEIE